MKRLFCLFFLTFLYKIDLPVYAESEALPVKKGDWSFEGVTGSFPIDALQRGFLVYKQVCSACHGLDHLRYGNLAGQGKEMSAIRTSNLGLTTEEVKAIASEFTVKDLTEDGQVMDRKALPSDFFIKPYPNEKAACAANNGAAPPDLSLIVKARPGGANYIYSLLTGYQNPPEGMVIGEGRHYNPYFTGGQISMASPLIAEGQVAYPDGTVATIDQMAKDVVTFLTWASDPKAEERKKLGIKVLFYLCVMTGVFYFAKRRIWQNIKD